MKGKQKKKLAYAALGLSVVLVVIGAIMRTTMPPELPISASGWFENERVRSDREFWSFAMFGAAFLLTVSSVSELLRQAKKLKV